MIIQSPGSPMVSIIQHEHGEHRLIILSGRTIQNLEVISQIRAIIKEVSQRAGAIAWY